MSEIGNGTGSGYPGALDTDTTQEVNSPNVGKTKARAEVVNDLASAVVAIETALGTNPQGIKSDVKTFLQVEHGTDGTHLTTKVVTPATLQNATNIYAADTGAVNAYVIALNPVPAALTTGMRVYVKIANANTITTPTLNIGVGGAVTIVNNAGGALLAGSINAGNHIFQYDGTNFRLITKVLADNEITTAKIADSAVTLSKLAYTTYVNLFDDFLYDNLIGWTNLNSGSALLTGADSGVIEISPVGVGTYCGFGNITSQPFRASASATMTFEAKVKISGTVFERSIIGFVDNPTSGTFNSYCFDRNTATGFWRARTRKDGVTEGLSADMDVSPSTTYQTLKIVVTNTDAKYYVDGVLKTTVNTNLPTGNMGVSATVMVAAGDATRKTRIDYIKATLDSRL